MTKKTENEVLDNQKNQEIEKSKTEKKENAKKEQFLYGKLVLLTKKGNK